jgi:hypothetical protein
MNEEKPVPGFAPDDITDGRRSGDWKTRYPDNPARCAIAFEAFYVSALLAVMIVLLLLIWLQSPRTWFGLDEVKYKILEKYVCAWIGGSLGGILFDIKWLYHSVAKNLWNIDRRLWRLFTPHVSGALAFVFVLLISCGVLRIFDQATLDSPSVCLAIGFMVGYFSDGAMAKLSETAQTLFGTTHQPGKDKGPD